MERMGFEVTHVYGLTETYGPAVVCAWQDAWNALPVEKQAALKARQGVRYLMLEGLMVADPQTLEPVPRDGQTMGEILMRGNNVMKGYLKNPHATGEAFEGGWFHSGDLAVWHEDGYVEIRGPVEGRHHFGRREHFFDRGRRRALPSSRYPGGAGLSPVRTTNGAKRHARSSP